MVEVFTGGGRRARSDRNAGSPRGSWLFRLFMSWFAAKRRGLRI